MSGLLRWYGERVCTVAGLLSVNECEELVALAESVGFEPAGVRTAGGPVAMPQIRNNDRAMLEHPTWVALIWERVQALPLPELDGQVPIGLPKALRFYRYRPGQRFKMHKDGPWQESGHTSKLTLLIYLNQGYQGGETDFREFAIQGEAGMGLLFVHDTWHEGASLVEGTKYVLRSDLLYGASTI